MAIRITGESWVLFYPILSCPVCLSVCLSGYLLFRFLLCKSKHKGSSIISSAACEKNISSGIIAINGAASFLKMCSPLGFFLCPDLRIVWKLVLDMREQRLR